MCSLWFCCQRGVTSKLSVATGRIAICSTHLHSSHGVNMPSRHLCLNIDTRLCRWPPPQVWISATEDQLYLSATDVVHSGGYSCFFASEQGLCTCTSRYRNMKRYNHINFTGAVYGNTLYGCWKTLDKQTHQGESCDGTWSSATTSHIRVMSSNQNLKNLDCKFNILLNWCTELRWRM